MVQLAGYTTTAEVYQGLEAALYRGYRNADHAPTAIKLLKGDPPNARAIARLVHEHALLRDLAIPGVAKAYGLEQHGGSLALILSDLDGAPLHALIKAKRLDLSAALRVASSLAGVLDSLHRSQIIHKDIKPQSVLFNEKTGAVALIDFGAATRLSREPQHPESPHRLEGTLAYMSPEQTGRMNRVVDARTDLYSLGVTLYEMLTFTLPFQSRDPMELIHSHIARRPTPPHEISPAIPRVVSDITMKLLAKAAEDRYQSAGGLKADLSECIAQLEAKGRIDPFPLLRSDRSERLGLPQRLYGRERECLLIEDAWKRATAGSVELLLVSGYSGVGKSVLVQEIHKSIARGKGHFIAGKFNQLDRGIPYAPIVHAFRDLIRYILTEPGEALARWKARLMAALGTNGQILVDLVPELELVIGSQPGVPELGPTESQNRFSLVFQSFLRTLATSEHPIAIFLDDLQWADPASLKLIELLLTDPDQRCLLVLGACRDNEVDKAHPLMLAVNALRAAGARVSDILLSPLSLPDVTDFVADALGMGGAEIAPLAEIVFDKTQGNPFFMSQFLDMLEQEKLLGWDADLHRWSWDAGRIAEQMMADNVVDVMVAKMKRLPEDTRRILKLCAAMGNRFDLSTLSIIDEAPLAKTAVGLWDALREGLVLPLGLDYRFMDDAADLESFASSKAWSVPCKFMHDRVRQAAYSLVEDSEKQGLHLRIGRLLLSNAHGDPQDDALFDIPNHLNAGAALITDRAERILVARLNLAAGKKAKAAAAAAAALGYFRAGLAMLGEGSWEEEYDLALALYMNRAECEYISGAFDEVDASFDVLLRHVKFSLDRARVHQLRIVVYTAIGQFKLALDTGRAALAPYGLDLPDTEEASKPAADAELEELHKNLSGRSLEDLLNAPLMTDPDKQVASHILTKLVSAAFFTGPNIYSFIIARQLNLSLEYGYAEALPSAYGSYSVILYAWLGRYKESYDYGKLALDLCDKFHAVEQRCQVIFMFAHIVAFYRPLRSSLSYLEEAIRAGLETGDLPYASYSAWLHIDHRLGLGDDLAAIAEEADRYLALMQRTKNPATSAILRVTKQMSANLRGLTRSRYTLDDDTFDAESFEEALEKPGFGLVAAWFYTAQMEILAIHGEYEGALAMARIAEEKGANVKGFHTETDRRFFTCLVHCALYPTREPAEREQLLTALLPHYSKLAVWAEAYPESFLHKKLLVDAERARISGDEIRALNLYCEAIELAKQNGFFHHEAIGNELAARFHLAKGRTRIAAMHMVDAHQGYLRWGATAKAEDLVEKYPDLFARAAIAPPPANADQAGSTSPPGHATAVLDVATISRAAETIASEIIIEKVIDQVMRIVIENAGAQRGVLLLCRDGRLTIDATVTVDPDRVTVGPPVPAEASTELALSVVHYVERTQEPVVLGDASHASRFAGDPYIAAHPPRSLLCLAMMHRGKLTGILYLENNAATDVFTPSRVELCQILSSQAAIAVENAWLVARTQAASDELRRSNEALEDRIARRTEELREANERLVLELKERERAEDGRQRLQEEIIQVQTERLSEMSTPLIPITDQIMVMPLIGMMDAQRAQQMLTTALEGAQKNRATMVILDITGVRDVDASVARMFVSTASALRLLGTQTVLTGIRPEVARMLIELDVNLGTMVTKANLQSGIAFAMKG